MVDQGAEEMEATGTWIINPEEVEEEESALSKNIYYACLVAASIMFFNTINELVNPSCETKSKLSRLV